MVHNRSVLYFNYVITLSGPLPPNKSLYSNGKHALEVAPIRLSGFQDMCNHSADYSLIVWVAVPIGVPNNETIELGAELWICHQKCQRLRAHA